MGCACTFGSSRREPSRARRSCALLSERPGWFSITTAMNKKLRLPVALAVVVLSSSATGCDDGTEHTDAAVEDGTVADVDAGCEPFEEYDPVTMTCQPVV